MPTNSKTSKKNSFKEFEFIWGSQKNIGDNNSSNHVLHMGGQARIGLSTGNTFLV